MATHYPLLLTNIAIEYWPRWNSEFSVFLFVASWFSIVFAQTFPRGYIHASSRLPRPGPGCASWRPCFSATHPVPVEHRFWTRGRPWLEVDRNGGDVLRVEKMWASFFFASVREVLCYGDVVGGFLRRCSPSFLRQFSEGYSNCSSPKGLLQLWQGVIASAGITCNDNMGLFATVGWFWPSVRVQKTYSSKDKEHQRRSKKKQK